jgi:probable nitrogen fixation protein
MSMSESLNGTASTELLKSPLIKALVQQIRGQDAYGIYRTWSDELLIKPFIVTKQKKREISLEGEVDMVTRSRIMVFYRAIAACLEEETGLLSQVVLDLSHEGFGWVLIFSGRLLLTVKTLRDAHRFGFDSLEKMVEEGEKTVEKGIDLAQRFPEVGQI